MVHLSPGVSLPRKSGSAWRYRKDDYLTLDSLVFFVANERLKLSEYVKACNAAAVQVVPFGERKALLDFLRGDKDSSSYVDQDREAQQQQRQPPQLGASQAAAPPSLQTGVGSSGAAGQAKQAAPFTPSAALRDSGSSLATRRKRAHDAGEDDRAELSAAHLGSSAAAISSNIPFPASASASSSLSAALPGSPSDSSSLPASLRSPSTWQLSDVLSEERVYLTRVSCLQARQTNFSAVLSAWDEAQSHRAQRERHTEADELRKRKAAKAEPRQSSSSNSSSRASGGHVSGSSASSSSNSRQATPHSSLSAVSNSPSSVGGIPIILVPSSLSSCLTLYNARDFLEAGQLIPTADKRAAMAGLAKPPYIRLQRPSCIDKQRSVAFDVMDDVSQLRSSDDWRRVVAVFVSGSAWQFDGWPAPLTSPAAIAAHLSAFYMHYSDEPVNKNVQQWRVHRLTAHRDKHHHDRSLQLDFWNTLTEQLKCNSKLSRLNI